MRFSGLPQSLALLLGDVLSALVAHLLASSLLTALGRPPITLESTLIWLALWLLWRAYQGLYPGYGRSPQTELRLHTVGTVQVAVAQLAAAFAVHRFTLSVLGVVIEWSLILMLSLLTRYAVRALLIHLGQYGRAISVIGAGRTAALTIAHLRDHPAYGLKPVVAYDDNPLLHGTSLQGVPVVGSIDLALTNPRTEQALISIPGARAETQQRLVNSIYAAFPITWVVPDLFGVPNQALQPHNIGIVASLEVKNNLRSVRTRAIKRTSDFVLSLLGLLVIAPFLLVIAVLIRMDSPGPVLYKAPRLGRNLSPFSCYKFRSMYQDAEERLQHILSADPHLRAEYETYHKLKDDPRVTRIGGVLRRFSLDELPQILNVLQGDMSLVGPRPYLPREQRKMGTMTGFIAQVRPGMTGYWQVSGRNSSTFEERLDMDRFYITNWTPWLDLVILLQTVRVVLLGKGAY
ncbi:undecaprenyl-phosphate galactosephosphotransferase [Deinococcus phoenicis]|uniref:Undecaprenyl-phosphate galactosephosphotransferase n=1 Tax=Deinococcus phoenicis TaxID=1476583 RepID=A0A016QL16_9DEIO|nr:undecaprenyl-phosphate galactose phosphotransferase WbaP [Deinococcus phoenicis]EYB66758.1 undecaprenyl-phosphate galactosephosphotransferase [Deinococcus phoenicis]